MSITVENKNDMYTVATEQVLQYLENGIIPWRVSWTQSGIPQNLITHKPYRNINVWLLAAHNYPKNFFLTEEQLQKLDGKINDHESAIPIFYGNGNTKKNAPTLSHQNVYNVTQCREIKIDIPNIKRPDTIELCKNIIARTPKMPSILHFKEEPYYHPLKDFINIPKTEEFPEQQLYYASLFHELIHCTGHESRLGRKELLGTAPFGSTHTLEELVAEIGTAYLLSYTGITTTQTIESDEWIKGWIYMLRQDDQLIFTASNLAQKAVDFILNNNFFE